MAGFVSYCGNARWSFERAVGMISAKRFLFVAVLNVVVITVISEMVGLYDSPSYYGVILVAVFIPLVGFVTQKLWVFR